MVCIFLFFIAVLSFYKLNASAFTIPLWPRPSSAVLGSSTWYMSSNLMFLQKPADEKSKSEILDKGFVRYRSIIGEISSPPESLSSKLISSCVFEVENFSSSESIESQTLLLGVDESYSIELSTDGSCSIHSTNVWGALKALETFSQLLNRDANSNYVYCANLPVAISDKPRFAHRGLLVDTSRHYLPVSSLKSMVDALSMNKFNVLHW
jgi:hexosaminidase